MTKSSDPRPPTCHQVDAGPVHWEVRVSEPEVTLIKADHIQVDILTPARPQEGVHGGWPPRDGVSLSGL